MKTYLKEWRIYAGLTQAELAEKMNVSALQVSSIETGLREPDHVFLKMFKQVVGCSHLAEPLLHAPNPTGVLKDVDMQRRYDELLQSIGKTEGSADSHE